MDRNSNSQTAALSQPQERDIRNNNTTCCAPLLNYYCICRPGYRIENQKRVIPNTDLNNLLQNDLDNCSLSIYIDSMSMFGKESLQLVRPSVVVRIVNIESGNYIKAKEGAAVQYTNPCRLTPTNYTPTWQQELIFNIEFKDLFNPNALILVEIFDVSIDSSKLGTSSLERIAWGFLFPLSSTGQSNISYHISRSHTHSHSNLHTKLSNNNDIHHRIQMYCCKGIGSMYDNLQANTIGINEVDFTPRIDSNIYNDYSIPAVYLEWLRLKVTPMHGVSLSMNLGLRQVKPSKHEDGLHTSHSDHSLHNNDNNGNSIQYLQYEPTEEEKRIRIAVLQRSRAHDEECIIPNKVLQRYTINSTGALIVSFSHSGHLLAVASLLTTGGSGGSGTGSSNRSGGSRSLHPGHNIYSIFLIDTDRGTIIWSEKIAHYGPVYILEWTADDSILLSCSSDGTLKLWNIISLHPLIKYYKLLLECMNMVYELDHMNEWKPQLLNTLSSSSSPSAYIYCAVFSDGKHNINTNTNSNSNNRNRNNSASVSSATNKQSGINNNTNTNNATSNISTTNTISQADKLNKKQLLLSCKLSSDFTNCGINVPAESMISNYFNIFNILNDCWIQLHSINNSNSNSENNGDSNSNTDDSNASDNIHDSSNNINTTTNITSATSADIQRIFSADNQLRNVPDIYTGGSNGRISIWNGYQYITDIFMKATSSNSTSSNSTSSSSNSNSGNSNSANNNNNANATTMYTAHDARVNTLIIDKRSTYLISGDSEGDIIMWKLDLSGQYQFLRKIKNDINSIQNNSNSISSSIMYHPLHTGVLSLVMHPVYTIPHMLCMSQNPPTLRVVNLSTLRIHTTCYGFTSSHSISPSYNATTNLTTYGDYCYCKAEYSSDGTYIIAGVGMTVKDDRKSARMIHKLLIWDAMTGQQIKNCSLADVCFPYSVRSTAWHPTQHAVAVAVTGPDAALVVYCADRPRIPNKISHAYTRVSARTLPRSDSPSSALFQSASVAVKNDIKEYKPSSATKSSNNNNNNNSESKDAVSKSVDSGSLSGTARDIMRRLKEKQRIRNSEKEESMSSLLNR